MEIERKWLVPGLPTDLARHPAHEIDQGYLALTPEGVEVRVRCKNGQRFLTVKHGPGLSRVEVEVPLEAKDFDALWPLTEGKRLRKTRYNIPWHDGRTVELDVYADGLEGLWVAEVEFDDEASAHAFEPPEFFGREITGDPAYRNEKLAREGLATGKGRG